MLDYVWVIQNGVHYEGDNASFLDSFSDNKSDLIVQHIGKRDNDWYWWKPKNSLYLKEYVCGFLPIFRLSRKLLEQCSIYIKNNQCAYHEIFYTSIASKHEFVMSSVPLENIGFVFWIQDLYIIKNKEFNGVTK